MNIFFMSDTNADIRIYTHQATYHYADVDLNVSDHIKDYLNSLPRIQDRSIIIRVYTRRGNDNDFYARNITDHTFVELNRRLNLVGKNYEILPTIYRNRGTNQTVMRDIVEALHLRLMHLEATAPLHG